MAQSILIFDFGDNEEAAQQARHKFEGWKQAFRLGDKIAMKFERVAKDAKNDENAEGGEVTAEEKSAAGKKSAKKKPAKQEKEEESSDIRILIRLNFSDHEKLSHQRWLDRIPGEEPFKSARNQAIRQGDADFQKTAEIFDSLD
jgi:hypothetical protein